MATDLPPDLDPVRLLTILYDISTPSDRKLRLFAVSVYRKLIKEPDGEVLKSVLETIEMHAEEGIAASTALDGVEFAIQNNGLEFMSNSIFGAKQAAQLVAGFFIQWGHIFSRIEDSRVRMATMNALICDVLGPVDYRRVAEELAFVSGN